MKIKSAKGRGAAAPTVEEHCEIRAATGSVLRVFLESADNEQTIGAPSEPREGGHRSAALALRLEAGAEALAALAGTLSEEDWRRPLPKDGRPVGVVVHHVASMYPVEIELAKLLAAGKPIAGVTWDTVATINHDHAIEHAAVSKDAAIALLRVNGAAAALAIRSLTGEELDRAAPVSLNSDAPLTCQFFLEDHAVRHSYHHLAGIKAALAR